MIAPVGLQDAAGGEQDGEVWPVFWPLGPYHPQIQGQSTGAPQRTSMGHAGTNPQRMS